MSVAPGFIQEMRHSVLDLHKALMDAQRVRYEREHGRISTSGEFLGLVLEHPSFAWLRTLSALIARIDESIEEPSDKRDKPHKPVDELSDLIGALRSLISRDGTHAVFSAPYWQMVNEEPAVLVEHVKLWRLLER
jgi:hypothetical protein